MVCNTAREVKFSVQDKRGRSSGVAMQDKSSEKITEIGKVRR